MVLILLEMHLKSHFVKEPKAKEILVEKLINILFWFYRNKLSHGGGLFCHVETGNQWTGFAEQINGLVSI